jgi:hypothetical protein
VNDAGEVYEYPESVIIQIRTGDRVQTLEMTADEFGMVKLMADLEVGRDVIEVDLLERMILPSREARVTLKVLCGRMAFTEAAPAIRLGDGTTMGGGA